MNELGNLLREAREAKGLTLAEAWEATRIRAKFLEALEAGQYEALPSPLHARGFLSNYARYLDLDPRPLVERYELSKDRRLPAVAEPNGEGISEERPLRQLDEQPFFNPVNVELSGKGRVGSGSTQRLLIILALIVSLVLVANRLLPMLLGNENGSVSLSSGLQEAVRAITGELAAADSQTPEAPTIPGASESITSTNRVALELPTPTATRPALPATLETIRLRLEVTERAWMQVTIDGEVVFEGQAKSGDEPYEWEATQEARFVTGNAIGVFVTINDIQLGRLGGRSDVVDETWTTTGEAG